MTVLLVAPEGPRWQPPRMRTKSELLDAVLQEVEAMHDAEPDPRKRELWWELIEVVRRRLLETATEERPERAPGP